MANNKLYWTKDMDGYIEQYLSSNDHITKNRLFSKYLYPPINELSKQVLYFLINKRDIKLSETEIEILIQDCIILIEEKLYKYNKLSGSSFSYFQFVAKNHYVDYFRNEPRRNKYQKISINEQIDSENESFLNQLVFDNDNIMDDAKDEFIKKIKNILKNTKKNKEIYVFSEMLKYLSTVDVLEFSQLESFIESIDKVNRDIKYKILISYGIKIIMRHEEAEGKKVYNNFDWLEEELSSKKKIRPTTRKKPIIKRITV